jgi:hypothetical protein
VLKALGAAPDRDIVRRSEAVRNVVDRLSAAKMQPATEAGIAQLATDLRGYTAKGREEDEPLRQSYRHLLAAKVAAIAPNLSDKAEWDKLLPACVLALPGAPEPVAAWVLGCGVESAAELLAAQKPPDNSDLAAIDAALAERKSADPTGGYLPYAQARYDWERRNDKTAAMQLLKVYPETGEPAPALKAPFRKAAAARVLEASAVRLRQPDPDKPFKSDDAAPALVSLKAARRLSANGLSAAGKLCLALAAWAANDKSTARTATDEFATPESRKNLSAAEAFAVLRARAGSQDETTEAGQVARADSLAAIIELHRARPKDVTVDAIVQTVVKPMLSAESKPVAGGAKVPQARLMADTARLIQSGSRTDPKTWKRLLGSADPVGSVRGLFTAAATLDPRPEYAVQKVFTSVLERLAKGNGGPTPEMIAEAEQIIAANPKYAGGHILRGELLHMRAVGETDRAKQMADLRAAVKEFSDADEPGAGAAATSLEDQRWLYQNWSGACLLLGNFTTDRVERDESIRAAVTYADKLKEKDANYLEGRLALGNACEDVAYFLKDNDSFEKAIREFEEAKPLATAPGEIRPWLACGRCQYRRAEMAPATTAERRNEAAIWLGLAETDLGTALSKLGEATNPNVPDYTAEARYFLGLCHALRMEYAKMANKPSTAEDEAAKAETEFEQAAAACTSSETAGRHWGRLVGVGRCGVQVKWASVISSRDKRKAAEKLKTAKKLAVDLRAYSRVTAALWEASAMDVEHYLKDATPEFNAEIVKVLEDGLKGAGDKDLADQYEMGRRLWGWYTGGNLPGGKPNYDKAYQGMATAARAAAGVGMDADTVAGTLFEAAMCRVKGLPAEKDDATKLQHRRDLLDCFRLAAETAPSHQYVWYWKILAASEGCMPLAIALVEAQPVETPERTVKEAKLLEEAARYYRDVKVTMPLAQGKNFPWFEKERKITSQKAKPALEKAIAAAPKDADVWMWHWGIAESINDAANGDVKGDALAEAKKQIAAAEHDMPKEPPHIDGETPQRYRDRKELWQQYRDRISQLRKDLDAQQ